MITLCNLISNLQERLVIVNKRKAYPLRKTLKSSCQCEVTDVYEGLGRLREG